jgi:hypothetical protein
VRVECEDESIAAVVLATAPVQFNFMKQAFALVGLLAAASCSSPSPTTTTASPTITPDAAAAQQTASSVQQAVATYIKAHPTDFTGYEPVRWSQPLAYTKTGEATIKGVVAMQLFDNALVSRSKALAAYKASLARHDAPAKTEAVKARYRHANKYNDSLLAVANSFAGIRDTTRLGTEIVHLYRTKAKTGFMVLDSATFVVYPTGKVEQL